MLGKIIGKGNTAEVYELANEEKLVLKLFFERMPYEFIDREFKVSRKINDLGIPSPKVDEIVEVDQKWGILYEKISGKSLTQLLSSRPFLIKRYGEQFARLQGSFNSKSTDFLTPQKEYLSRNISGTDLLTMEEKHKILNYLKQLPIEYKVCHGDFHPDNVMFIDGEPRVLDWMTGTSGNPCGDVARTLIILRYSYLPPGMPKIMKLMIQAIRNRFANHYFHSYVKLMNISAESIYQWFLPVMAARLVEEIPQQESQFLLKKIKELLLSPDGVACERY